jgi:hypothetical protein
MKSGQISLNGAVTFWRGSDSDRSILERGLDDNGLSGLMPKQQTPKAVLNAALVALYANKTTLIRPLSKKNGFTVVSEDRGQDENRYDSRYTFEVDDDGNVSSPSAPWAEVCRVRDQYKKSAGVVPAKAITNLLTTAVSRLSGIPLRESGGVYWIPRDKLDDWATYARIVEKAGTGTMVHVMQTAADASSLRAIKEGILADIQSDVDQIMKDIETGDLHEAALEAREARADSLRKRLLEYEGILGETLGDMRKVLDITKESISEAVVMRTALSTTQTF